VTTGGVSVREMSDDDVSRQATKLHGYLVRGGDIGTWWQSKGFTVEDERAVRAELKRQIESMVATVTQYAADGAL
jgi:hypothetical protein